MELSVVFVLLLAQATSNTFSNEHHTIHMPSTFLEPPPAAVHTYNQPSVSHRSIRQQPNTRLLSQPKDLWPSKVFSTQNPFLQRDYSYYDLQCNPCNSIPWIPVIGYVYQQHPSHQPLQLPPHTYYQAINDLTTNLVKPAGGISPTFPFYMRSPVYQQQLNYDNLWQQAVTLHHTAPPPIHPVKEIVHENQPVTPYYTGDQGNIQDLGFSQWINDAKPVPLDHYVQNIDYPVQYVQSPALDIPHRIPESAPLAPPLAYSSAASNTFHDSSNLLEDSKYSSSEDKFSVSNSTGKDKDTRIRSHKLVGDENMSSLTEYLTPPPKQIANEWAEKGNANPTEELKPLQDWAFIKDLEPKIEKRKKQIQIIIPYTINKNNKPVGKNLKDNLRENHNFTRVLSPTILPLIGYLKGNSSKKQNESTDWQKLRKAIDSWTEQKFSNHKYNSSVLFDTGLSTLPPSKEIPKAFFRPISSHRPNEFNIRSEQMQSRVSSGIKDFRYTTEKESQAWNSASATTKGKVYIVTPLPLTNYSFSSNGIDNENWTFL